MRLTIIADDNVVIVGGKAHVVDCSSLVGVHAVQWYDTHGVLEFKADSQGAQKPNEKIEDLAPYQKLVDAWTAIETAPPAQPAQVTEITKRQLLLMMLQLNLSTSQEAIAAAQTGALPAIMSSYFNTLAEPQKTVATVTWASMGTALLADPILVAIAAANNIDSVQLARLFNAASAL